MSNSRNQDTRSERLEKGSYSPPLVALACRDQMFRKAVAKKVRIAFCFVMKEDITYKNDRQRSKYVPQRRPL